MKGRLRRHACVLPLLAGCLTTDVDVGGYDSGPAGEASGAHTASTSSGSLDPVDPGSSDAAGSDESGPGSEAAGGVKLDVAGGGADTGALPGNCASELTDSMLLIDLYGTLHRYYPDTLEIETLGTPACEGALWVKSMTVDRTGLLWAMMVEELTDKRTIYTIDPVSLECQVTDFAVDVLADGLEVHGLAFVSDDPGGEAESLYVGVNFGEVFDGDFNDPLSLARIDLSTMEMTTVGTAELVATNYYQRPYLVGTGGAQLFGFFPGDVQAFADIDPATSAVVSSDVVSLGLGTPQVLAQWAGRHLLFAPNGVPVPPALKQQGSFVVSRDPVTGDIENLPDIDTFTVAGAAVSTCAPYQPEG